MILGPDGAGLWLLAAGVAVLGSNGVGLGAPVGVALGIANAVGDAASVVAVSGISVGSV